MNSITLQNKKITIMGLGLNGGGLEAARYCAKQGAKVTVTDLRSSEELAPSVKALSEFNIQFVLGEHRDEDFTAADIVIKNPAVPPSSKYLKMAKNVQSDMSLFLDRYNGPIIAVTGTKGKSSTVSAVYHGLKKHYPGTQLGGNITISPLAFVDKLKHTDPVVLELSSWQLADISDIRLLNPKVAVITNIMHDHQNRYNHFQEYVDDKRRIYQGQSADNYRLFFADDEYGPGFLEERPENSMFFSYNKETQAAAAWIENKCAYFTFQNRTFIAADSSHPLKGDHMKLNLAVAGLSLALFGVKPEKVAAALADFGGVAHRMEKVAETDSIIFYNDSAATIPDALVATAKSFDEHTELIIGGTDKELDFTCLQTLKQLDCGIHVLAGTAYEKIAHALKQKDIIFSGPFETFEAAFTNATEAAEQHGQEQSRSNEKTPLIMTPGCASFGMFKNEFHRGNTFTQMAEAYEAERK